MIVSQNVTIALVGCVLGMLIGYFLPRRKRTTQEVLLESETKELESLADIKEQLFELDRLAHIGKISEGFRVRSVSSVETNPNVAIPSIIEKCNFKLEGSDIKLNHRVEASLPTINMPHTIFMHVLMAILINAIESISENGKIDIHARKRDDFVYVEIKDDGVGLDHSLDRKIFEPFFTTKRKGTGCGLYSVKELLEGARGKIIFKSVKGGGSTVSLYFPVA